MKIARKLCVAALSAVSMTAFGQVPDLLTSFDAGGRAFGAGGSLYSTATDTLSTHNNPAGLAYVDQTAIGMTARSYPTSRTVVTGPLNNLRLNTKEEEGDLRLGHVGYVRPLSGRRGTIGISYTTGGWMDDRQIGLNLPGGIQNYLDALRIKSDFIDIGWGRASEDQSTSFGLGLVIGMNSVYNRQHIVFTDPQADPINARSDEQSYGIGIQAGMIMTPKNQPNLSIGASVRTPITMNKSNGALALYDKIPGRLAVGLALRQDGYRNGRDYVVYGAEVQSFFSPSSNSRVQQDSHTSAHFGLEYNYSMESFTLPIRLGYSAVPKGGDGFDSRSSFTYGIGYRPNGKNWSFDIAYGSPSGGAKDTAISFNYRFK